MSQPLTFVQGPLPENMTTVDPSLFLEAWIAGSSVYGFNAGSFKGGTLTFIVSQTNPPPIEERQRGLLWFARGEGILYTWDQSDLPSGVSSARDTLINWIAIAGRRDIWVKAMDAVVPGTPMQLIQSGASNTEHEITTDLSALGANPNYRVLWAVSAFGTHQGSGIGATGLLTEMIFVARESSISSVSGPSGPNMRATELGFCNVRAASGDTGSAGPLAIDETASETQWFKTTEYNFVLPVGTNRGRLFLAVATDSSATSPGQPWLRPAFKRALPLFGIARI